MIQDLKDDKLVNQVGGRFKFTALVQHRVRELMDGARPLVERNGMSDLEVAIREIATGKITFEYDSESVPVGEPGGRARASKAAAGKEGDGGDVRGHAEDETHSEEELQSLLDSDTTEPETAEVDQTAPLPAEEGAETESEEDEESDLPEAELDAETELDEEDEGDTDDDTDSDTESFGDLDSDEDEV